MDFLNIAEAFQKPNPQVLVHNTNSQIVFKSRHLGPALRFKTLKGAPMHLQILVYPAVQKVSPWLVWESGWSVLLLDMTWKEIEMELNRCRSLQGIPVYYHIHHQYGNWTLDGLGTYMGRLYDTEYDIRVFIPKRELPELSRLAGFR